MKMLIEWSRSVRRCKSMSMQEAGEVADEWNERNRDARRAHVGQVGGGLWYVYRNVASRPLYVSATYPLRDAS